MCKSSFSHMISKPVAGCSVIRLRACHTPTQCREWTASLLASYQLVILKFWRIPWTAWILAPLMINEINNGVARICANCDYRNIRSTVVYRYMAIWNVYLLGQKSCGGWPIVLAVGHQKVNPNDFLEAKSSDLWIGGLLKKQSLCLGG